MKKHLSFVVILAIIIFAVTGITACNNGQGANANEGVGVLKVGEVYGIAGEYANDSYGGTVLGSFFVEILEIDGNWVRVKVVKDNNNMVGDFKDLQEEGRYKDLWLNTQKFNAIITEPDMES